MGKMYISHGLFGGIVIYKVELKFIQGDSP